MVGSCNEISRMVRLDLIDQYVSLMPDDLRKTKFTARLRGQQKFFDPLSFVFQASSQRFGRIDRLVKLEWTTSLIFFLNSLKSPLKLQRNQPRNIVVDISSAITTKLTVKTFYVYLSFRTYLLESQYHSTGLTILESNFV